MTIKSVQIVEFCLNWKKSFENWQYFHYTLNHVPWVLSEQVGDKGLRFATTKGIEGPGSSASRWETKG